jgi:hypothetical protein
MSRHITLAATALLALLVAVPSFGATTAWAHAERPASVTQVQAGPYAFSLALYAEQPRAGQDLVFVLAPTPSGPQPSSVRVSAQPGLGTNATPTRAEFAVDPDNPAALAGSVRLSVTGAWLLEVVADGPAGEGRARLPLTAAAPGALPVWLGWVIGLAPLLGVVWFGWWQHRYLRCLEARAAI